MSTNPTNSTTAPAPAQSNKGIKAIKKLSDKRRKTYTRMFRSIILAVIVIVVILVVLQFLGVNVSSMLAGVGIASIVIGFALQDAMKDIFRGLEIVNGGYYNIGDIIKFGDNYGQVLSITLRTTRIQDYNTMNIVSIANRKIDQIEVVSEYIYLPIPLPLRIKPDSASKVVSEIADQILLIPEVTSAINQGPSAITNSALTYQIQITCDPAARLATRRAALEKVISILAEHKILLPYQQLELHARKTS